MNSFPEHSVLTHCLSEWFQEHARTLPWRNTKDPYRIWLSEIMLQQTRVEQGLPYYLRFTERFPDVASLASAPQDDVLKLWQGLGYYSRARNLHQAARQVVENHGGRFPQTYEDLLLLKGVGEYTAAAVASIAFGEARAVVDGNVQRVLARLFYIETPINSTAGKKEFAALATALLDPARPGDHNQAMMDFGAMHCTPLAPRCPECPLANYCLGLQAGVVQKLPVKIPAAPKRDRFVHYLVLNNGVHTWLRKRTGKDIWQGLYEFPTIETPKAIALEELFNMEPLRSILAEGATAGTPVAMRHILSHQYIHAVFLPVLLQNGGKTGTNNTVNEKSDNHKHERPWMSTDWICIEWKDIDTVPVSRLVEIFLEKRSII